MNLDNEIISILNSLISNIEVKYYKNQNKKINSLIFNYEKKIKNLKRELLKNENKIYRTCVHVWEKDYDDYYSRYKICHKCNLSNIPCVYN